MDTKTFLLERQDILDRLADRRSLDRQEGLMSKVLRWGLPLPFWTRIGMGFLSRGGLTGKLLDVGMSYIAPLLFRNRR
jgi:hypothetical protein